MYGLECSSLLASDSPRLPLQGLVLALWSILVCPGSEFTRSVSFVLWHVDLFSCTLGYGGGLCSSSYYFSYGGFSASQSTFIDFSIRGTVVSLTSLVFSLGVSVSGSLLSVYLAVFSEHSVTPRCISFFTTAIVYVW